MSEALWAAIRDGIWQTLAMTIISTLLSYLIGLPYGIILKTTGEGEIFQNKLIHGVFVFIANVIRSVPFMILLVFLIPFTRFIVGQSIGTKACIVPLTIGTFPIVARMVEASLNEVQPGIIEAAKSMGATPFQMITNFMLPESMPSLVSGAAINLATVLGYSAMAGCIGGGGLGAIALNYGYYRYKTDVLMITVVILIFIVQIFQESGNLLSRKIRHL